MKTILIVFFTILLSVYNLAASDNTPKKGQAIGGLEFCARTNLAHRTSYKVYPEYNSLGKEILDIELDFSIYSTNSIGHLITCNGKDSELLNLIAVQPIPNDSIFLDLNLTAVDKKLSIYLLPEECKPNKWHRLKVVFSAVEGYAYISINDRIKKTKFTPFDLKEKYNITFGVCEHYLPLMPFSIKNMTINNNGDIENFPITENEGNVIHNDKGDARGEVKNPIWLLNQHKNWTKLLEFKSNETIPVFLDNNLDKIVFYNSKRARIYNINNKKVSSQLHNFKKPITATNSSNSYFDPSTGNFFIYNNIAAKINNTAVIYNYINNTQDILSNAMNECRYHHHSIFTDSLQNTIYQFGGYGMYSYHNTFKAYSWDENKWDNVKFNGDKITPRFYSSVGSRLENGEQITYLYGGYGNKSGKQRDGGEYIYDLYSINLANKHINKVHKFNFNTNENVPCQNLILDTNKPQFYTLCYTQYKPETQLQLYQFNWETDSCKPVSDSIPFISTKISTQVHLFEHKQSNQLFCVIQEFTENDKSTIKLYSLRTPLLETIETVKTTEIKQENASLWWLYVIITCIVIIGALTYKKHSKKVNKNCEIPDNIDENVDLEDLKADKTENYEIFDEIKQNAIFLMGDFLVLDKNKTNITHLFSPKVRNMFLLILFYTYSKKEQGIHADTLSSILWEDKPIVNARNLRGVNIKKLKDAISSIDGIELENNNSYWSVKIDNKLLYCDYIILNEIISKGEQHEISEDELLRFMPILNKGLLPKNDESEWMDGFRSSIENGILSIYMPLMKSSFEQHQFKKSYEIANVLLKIDPLNIEIAKVIIKSLIGLDDSVKASIRFRQFALAYYQAYNINLVYNDFCK